MTAIEKYWSDIHRYLIDFRKEYKVTAADTCNTIFEHVNI